PPRQLAGGTDRIRGPQPVYQVGAADKPAEFGPDLGRDRGPREEAGELLVRQRRTPPEPLARLCLPPPAWDLEYRPPSCKREGRPRQEADADHADHDGVWREGVLQGPADCPAQGDREQVAHSSGDQRMAQQVQATTSVKQCPLQRAG